jgi:diguanylate cyclase (GGDEF)-like protein
MAQVISFRTAKPYRPEKIQPLLADQPVALMTINRQEIEARTLHVANVLQSSLEPAKLIDYFSTEIKPIIPHDGIEYRNAAEHLDLHLGQAGKHSCTYNILLLDKSLGYVTLSRETKFSKQELEILDALLCALIYPLRNALLYKLALETALKDPVTGIQNRAALNTAMDREISLAHRHSAPLSVIMVDIDSFKKVNDSYGHLAGDAVLRVLAECLSQCVRGGDIVFRYGGEEFTVLLSNTDQAGAKLLADRIRTAVEKLQIRYDCLDIGITASLGVASFAPGDSAEGLLKRADQALYQAKQSGRNRVVCARN